ncbi:hypothetical protein mRhiFer1_008795 [Rhinolophus ferrumequinum]|uniref:SPATA31 domain-containing protein n=1 Tax=Rhinolophus ferrumequinum TaxID=59479 RepID=A0A7J8AET0_RHIFE|nr:hypothetical protein mRhiFer1_008795 [Rhinolophus ferrumequinum]
MDFLQWNVFAFLNSLIEICVSFGSVSLQVLLTCLWGLCWLLLFLCYLVEIPPLPPIQETKNIPKHWSRAKRRRKGGTGKGWRHYQRTEEEKTRLISIHKRYTNAPTGQLYAVVPNALLPSLPGVQPHPFPESQPLRLGQMRLLIHLQCTIPNVPPAPILQIGICGGYFHHLHSESEDSTSSIIQHLGWSLLYHQFERLWGLPSVAQSSQEDFCSFGPNSAYHGPSQVQIPISILPEAFPLSNELSNNVEHHHGKELIQHQWGLPGRIHESRALMRPPSDSSEISEPESNYGLSYISVYKGQSRKTLNVGSSPPRSFWERGSEMQHLEEDVGKDKGNSLENGPEGPLLGDSDSSSDEDLMDGSEEELDGPGVSLSDRLTDEALLTHTEGVSSVDVGASQGLPVHVEDRGVRMEQRQEPRGPRRVFRWCRKKILPARKRLSPQGPTSEGLGGGDPGLGTSQTRW